MAVQHRETTEIRQTQITDAARKLIISRGSEHITVRLIAQQIGITEAAIYRHFKSKRQILSVLVDNIDKDWADEIEKAVIKKESSVDRLHAILINRISVAEQKGGISFLVIAEILSFGDKRLNEQSSEVVDSYIHKLAQVISEGVKRGELKRGIDPLAAATILYGMVQGLVNVWALSNRKFSLIERYESCWQTVRKTILN